MHNMHIKILHFSVFDLIFRNGLCYIDITSISPGCYIDDDTVAVPSVFPSRCVRCENSFVTIQSSVSKSALKEKEQEKSAEGNKKPGAQQNKNKDIDKFHLYLDFTCNIQRIQPHQVETDQFMVPPSSLPLGRRAVTHSVWHTYFSRKQ